MLFNSKKFIEIPKKVDKLFKEFNSSNSPGCAVGILYQGKIIYSKGYGMANLEYEIPITDKTIFRIASVSKQFTAACILLLEEEGKIDFDDPLCKYFPDFPDYSKKIKIIHLLNHTSGIKDYLWLYNFAGYSFRALDLIDEDNFLEMIQSQETLNFTPGERYLYSNSGYVLLSIIIKRITGESTSDFAQRAIFNQLNMNQTHFHDNHQLIVKNCAKGYTLGKNGSYIIFETSNELVGDGAIFTNITDLSKWDGNFYKNELGNKSPDFKKKMFEPGILNNGSKINYALGLRITNYHGIRQIYHSGMIAGFRTSYMYFPDYEISIICLSNTGAINSEEYCYKIFDLLIERGKGISKNNKSKLNYKLNKDVNLRKYEGFFRNLETKSVYLFKQEQTNLIGELYAVNLEVLFSRTIYKHKENGEFIRISGILEPKIKFLLNTNDDNVDLIGFESDGDKIQFKKLLIPQITHQTLRKFKGRYYSKEIDTYYRLDIKEEDLLVNVKRIDNILLPYKFIGDNEFTYNQAFIKFPIKSKKVKKFELSSYRISKPIIFRKIK